MQFIAVEVFIYLFTVFTFINYKALFACVKDRACLKIEIPAYCFNIFGSIFGVLFCLLIKKLILGSKTIWQSMRKFPRSVWSVRTFPHMDKEETFFFLKTAHWHNIKQTPKISILAVSKYKTTKMLIFGVYFILYFLNLLGKNGTLVWSDFFLDNYFFIRLGNLKASL